MEFIRLCKDLADKGTLIQVVNNDMTAIYKQLNKNKDAYTSLFYFNQTQYDTFQKTGSVAGMTDVTTDKLTFDFDSEDDVEIARIDAVELVKRLQGQGYTEDNIRVFFSGNKGFEVSVQLESERLTPSETKNICMNIADGLATVDSKIYNATRIFRLPLTKHNKSGLFKYPLGIDDLRNLSVDDIKTAAQQTLDYSDIKDAWKSVKLTKLMKDLKLKTPVVKPLSEPVVINVNDVDWTKKPTDLSPAKWLVELGFFPAGSRSHAGMILASTYRNLGYDENKAYYLIKAAMEKQSLLMGCDKFPKAEIWSNIIRQVYSPSWNGGTYSEKSDELLQSLAASIPARHVVKSKEDVISVEQVGHIFEDYAKNIGKNRLEFGIPSLDAALESQVGRVYAIGGAPGSGKCHGIDTPILMFDGTIKKVQDVKLGDFLMGDDSTPRTVLGLARGQEMLYNIKQNNGDDYVVNESHILSLKGSSATRKQFIYGSIQDVPLVEYMQKGTDFKKRMKGYKVPVNFSKKELQIDPYIFGAWLGDGTTSKPEFTIAKQDVELIAELQAWGDSNLFDVNLKEYPSASDKVYTITVTGENNNFRKFLKETGLFSGKYIPQNYLTSNREDRLNLLAGLLDTDGYYDNRKHTFEFSSSDTKMMEQVLFLVRGLGFKSTMSNEVKHYKSFSKGKWYEGYSDSHRLYITGDNLVEIPTRIQRKKAVQVDKQRYQDLTEITVEPMYVGDYFGFEIDGNHRYLLGDFTVTHNTSLSLQLLNNTSKQGINSMFFSFDMSLEDVYQKLIQKHYRIGSKKVYLEMEDDVRRKQFKECLDENYSNVNFVRSAGMSIEEMKDRIIRTEQALGTDIKFILVDYLDLIRSDYSDPTQRSMYSVQGLKEIATALRKCVVFLGQPNKANQRMDEPAETYAAFKGSGALAELSNAMLWVSRPGASPRTFENDKYYSLDCLKNRHGAMFSLDFAWDGVTGSIRELEVIEKMNLEELRVDKTNKKKDDDSLF